RNTATTDGSRWQSGRPASSGEQAGERLAVARGDAVAVLVSSVIDQPDATALDRDDRRVVGGEQPMVEDGVAAMTGGVEGDDRVVGRAYGLCATGERRLEQAPAGRLAGIAQHVALAMDQALAVFEGAQLVCGGEADVGIRADAEAAAVAEEVGHVEQAVAEVGLGDRAEADDRLRPGDARTFVPVGVRGVDEAPVLVDLDGVYQEIDRATAVGGEAVVDLARLLADMDVRRLAAPGCGGPL